MTRSRVERDEWALAGECASGLGRARTALRLALAKATHEAAEGAVGR